MCRWYDPIKLTSPVWCLIFNSWLEDFFEWPQLFGSWGWRKGGREAIQFGEAAGATAGTRLIRLLWVLPYEHPLPQIASSKRFTTDIPAYRCLARYPLVKLTTTLYPIPYTHYLPTESRTEQRENTESSQSPSQVYMEKPLLQLNSIYIRETLYKHIYAIRHCTHSLDARCGLHSWSWSRIITNRCEKNPSHIFYCDVTYIYVKRTRFLLLLLINNKLRFDEKKKKIKNK